MSTINGMPGATASTALSNVQESEHAAAVSSDLKINYGDASRAAGLQNMLSKMQQLTVQAQTFVQSRNASLQ